VNERGVPNTVALIGGGFSGVMTCANLVRLWSDAGSGASRGNRTPRRIVLIERARPARGPAYVTVEPHHLLNVPAARMGAWADNPRDFLDWCAGRAGDDADVVGVGPASFVPRRLYARYLDDVLGETVALARASGITLDVINGAATGVTALPGQDGKAGRFRVALDGVMKIDADALVLCSGNMEPAPSVGGAGAESAGPIISNPWASGALSRIAPRDRVVIVGSGLTMLDVLWTLESRGHAGAVTVVSRHGLLPRVHRADPLDAAPVGAEVLGSPDVSSPLAALRWVRRKITEVEAACAGGAERTLVWTYVIDSLRPHTHKAWGGWNVAQRRQFVRHLRAMWDVHRHRVAPHVMGVVERMRAARRLEVMAASVVSVSESSEGARVVVRGRGGHATTEIAAEKVVFCTGPNPDLARTKDPLLASLVDSGLLVPDELGLGAKCDAAGRALRGPGVASDTPAIYVVGPLRRADLWESIAVPELRWQAAGAAKAIAGG
jgi:uncharacterized NAD(P)/FAD-binding protein YdhS